MSDSSSTTGFADLKKYKRIKDVPRPSAGNVAMFIHVLKPGVEVLKTIFSDGRTLQMMSAEDTRTQLESIKKR
jgi:hypothetical protein